MHLLKICLFCLGLFALPAMAELKIDISGAQSEPTPIALPEFYALNANLDKAAGRITQIVHQDLENSGLFRIINERAYLQRLTGIHSVPNFRDWQAINAQALVQGQLEETPSGELKVSFRVWDVYTEQQMIAKVLTSGPAGERKLAHIVADTIYERLTGEKGYFDTRIVFVSETGNPKNRKRRLAVMDQDGANVRYLTSGKDMVMTPRFSPNMQKITYMSYASGEPKVYLMDIESGKTELVGKFQGMSFAPRFSTDGQKLIMSLAKNGNSDIYTYDLETHEQKQLTNHPAIDTSPSYSPDGKNIVFNSDRSGNQQLYIMNADGSEAHRISFGEGTYATPVWSPRGDYIAFTKIKNGTFYIGLMRTDGSGERLIAQGFLVEGPTWAPNGRVLAFFRQEKMGATGWFSKGATLHSIDITGHNERELKTPTEASDPTWSAILH
ncbi:MAG: Tol-Pal system beta propeller repeat protein TolB [Alphaproteobacteria bacterium]